MSQPGSPSIQKKIQKRVAPPIRVGYNRGVRLRYANEGRIGRGLWSLVGSIRLSFSSLKLAKLWEEVLEKKFSFTPVQYADFFTSFDHADCVYDLDLSSMTWGDAYVTLFPAGQVLYEIERHDNTEAQKLADEIRSFIEEWGDQTLIGF